MVVAGRAVWLALQGGHQRSSQQVWHPWNPEWQSWSVRQVRANANPLVSIPKWADSEMCLGYNQMGSTCHNNVHKSMQTGARSTWFQLQNANRLVSVAHR